MPANDETCQFLNSVFVHNALLMPGHDTGVDAYGYAPGDRCLQQRGQADHLHLSAGIGAAGELEHSANFIPPLFVILQAETRAETV